MIARADRSSPSKKTRQQEKGASLKRSIALLLAAALLLTYGSYAAAGDGPRERARGPRGQERGRDTRNDDGVGAARPIEAATDRRDSHQRQGSRRGHGEARRGPSGRARLGPDAADRPAHEVAEPEELRARRGPVL